MAVTFERNEIERWFLHIFHKEFDFQQFLKNKIFKILEGKNFEIFLGSFLEKSLIGSARKGFYFWSIWVHMTLGHPKIAFLEMGIFIRVKSSSSTLLKQLSNYKNRENCSIRGQKESNYLLKSALERQLK